MAQKKSVGTHVWCKTCEKFVRVTTTAPQGRCALCKTDLTDMEPVEWEWPLV